MVKLLVYGLQNSGATLFTYFAAQRPGSLVVPDLWSMYAAPRWSPDADACVKAVVTTAFPLAVHRERFRPDITVLVVRRPIDNYASLATKPFRHHDGLLDEKFALADQHFANPAAFDAVVRFEDFVARPAEAAARLAALGWTLPDDAADMRRGARKVEADLWRGAPELYGEIEWGTGNARLGPLSAVRLTALEQPEARGFAEANAPRQTRAYDDDPPPNVRRVGHRGAVAAEHEMLATAGLATRLALLFADALAARDRDEAAAILADLRAVAPFSPAYWRSALQYDEMEARAGRPARLLERLLRRRRDGALALVLARHLAPTEPNRAEALTREAFRNERMPIEARVLLGRIAMLRADIAAAAGHAEAALEEMPARCRRTSSSPTSAVTPAMERVPPNSIVCALQSTPARLRHGKAFPLSWRRFPRRRPAEAARAIRPR